VTDSSKKKRKLILVFLLLILLLVGINIILLFILGIIPLPSFLKETKIKLARKKVFFKEQIFKSKKAQTY